MKRTHHKKERSELQEARAENRELKRELRQLQKRIKTLEKSRHIFHERELEPEEEELTDEEPKRTLCPSCFKGEVKEIYIFNRTWSECTLCDYRTKTIKIKLDDDES